jgi:hypothetical protein
MGILTGGVKWQILSLFSASKSAKIKLTKRHILRVKDPPIEADLHFKKR